MNNEILNWKTLTQRMRHLQLIHLIELHCLEVLEGLDFHSSIIFNSVCFPHFTALKFKWPEPDRSNIATHCCYFPGSKYIVKIRIFREWEGEEKRLWLDGAPHLWFPQNISIPLFLTIYRNRFTSECCRRDSKNLLFKNNHLCSSVAFWHMHTHPQWFVRERKTEWERKGGRGLIGFLWLQLNNIMHILA